MASPMLVSVGPLFPDHQPHCTLDRWKVVLLDCKQQPGIRVVACSTVRVPGNSHHVNIESPVKRGVMTS